MLGVVVDVGPNREPTKLAMPGVCEVQAVAGFEVCELLVEVGVDTNGGVVSEVVVDGSAENIDVEDVIVESPALL